MTSHLISSDYYEVSLVIDTNISHMPQSHATLIRLFVKQQRRISNEVVRVKRLLSMLPTTLGQ